MSRLTKLEIENVMRVAAVRLEPKAGVNVVRGRNSNGKTSVLRSVEFLFGGAKSHPGEVIRRGEEHAQVIGETDELIATRRWWKTPKGERTELEVRAKDGTPIGSPQTVLDKMYSTLASDPTSFTRLKADARLDLMRKIVGVDTAALERQREKLYAERTLVNRDLTSAQARLKAMSADKPPAPIDTAALLKERGELTNAQQWEKQARAERDAAMRRITDCQDAVRVAEQALAQAKVRLETAMKQAAEADNVADDAEEKAAGAAAKLGELDTQIQKASAVATANARWAEREKLAADVERLETDTKAKSAAIDKLDADKAALVAAAKFPVPGLSFGAEDVLLNGLPLEQASEAERLRLGVALCIASSPKLRVMVVPTGASLDEDSLVLLERLCEEHDMQCFVEMPGEKGAPGVIIRDGQVLES